MNDVTQLPMQTKEVTGQEIVKLDLDLPSISNSFKTMQEKAEKCRIALSAITKVETEEEDQKANLMLGKAKITFDAVETMRKEITAKTDEFKKNLMLPEKSIKEDMERLRALRNQRANKVHLEAQKATASIELERQKGEEKIRIKEKLKMNSINGIILATHTMNEAIRGYVDTMTLENWDSKLPKFYIEPFLKPDIYESFFKIEFSRQLVTEEEFQDMVRTIQEERTYDICNAEYIKVAKYTLNLWVEALPEIKKGLEHQKTLTDMGAKSGCEEQVKQNIQFKERLKIDFRERINKVKEEMEGGVKKEIENEQVKNEFQAQIAAQQVPEVTNVRKKRVAIVTCSDAEIVKVFSKVLFACFSHPDFKGYVKKPGEGDQLPEYQDWAKELLDFVADKVDVAIEGITFKELVSTMIKK